VLVIFGPRLAFLIYWLTPGGNAAVTSAYSGFVVPLLGWLFLPWTTLMYAITYSIGNGISMFDWIILAVALLVDLASYGLGAGRKRISYYEGY
jgi:hypothetical protein